MFGWFRKIHFRVPRHRALFRYYDGRKFVGQDPIEIQRRLESHPKYNAEKHPELADKAPETEAGKEAILICEDAYRYAFQVDPWDGKHGLTVNELYSLLWTYVNYVDAVKKNGSHSPMQQEHTAVTSDESTSETTNNSSELSLTKSDKIPGPSTDSESESRPQSLRNWAAPHPRKNGSLSP